MVVGLCYDLKTTYDIDSSIEYNDFSSLSEIEYVTKNLRILGHEVIAINGIKEFIKNIAYYKRNCDLIFNMMEGYKSRNREGLIPAICEAYDIPYTGTDSFGLSLSLNKYHMNQVIKSLGIKTPNSILIDSCNINKVINEGKYNFPCVLKPNHEGSSMGLYLIEKHKELIDKSHLLMERYQEQIILEEYIHGAEISVGILGTGEKAKIYCALQFIYEDGSDIDIYDYDTKYIVEHKSITPRIEKTILDQICKQSLLIHQRMQFRDISRIDWKVNDDGFYLIETTPLPSMDVRSDFDIGSKLKNESFDLVINEIIESAMDREVKKK